MCPSALLAALAGPVGPVVVDVVVDVDVPAYLLQQHLPSAQSYVPDPQRLASIKLNVCFWLAILFGIYTIHCQFKILLHWCSLSISLSPFLIYL